MTEGPRIPLRQIYPGIPSKEWLHKILRFHGVRPVAVRLPRLGELVLSAPSGSSILRVKESLLAELQIKQALGSQYSHRLILRPISSP